MDQQQKYQACKARNEQLLLNTTQLEQQMAHVKQQIDNKRRSIRNLQLKEAQFKQLVQHYQVPKPQTDSKRDLSQLLTITADKICNKLQLCIQQQLIFKRPISSADVAQIQSMIQRLPNKYDTQQYNQILEPLLKEVDQTEPIRESNSSVDNLLTDKKSQIKELNNRIKQLESETSAAEMELIKRIRELQRDHTIQSMLTKNLRMKAASIQTRTELESNKEQIEALNQEMDKMQQELDLSSLEERIQTIVEKMAVKHTQVQSLLSANDQFREELKNHSIQSKEDQAYVQKMKKSLLDLQLFKLAENAHAHTHPPSADHNPTLLDIKLAINPYCILSTQQAMDDIKHLIKSVQDLSERTKLDTYADVREKLESLVKKWSVSLEAHHIPLPYQLPENHDAIDNIIQSVDALREHIQEKEQDYIQQQQEKLALQLKKAVSIDKDIHQVEEAFAEREKIKQIGHDYTIQGKSFKEWLDRLQIKQ